MHEKFKKDTTKMHNESINQFIIECLFRKYFEEKEEIVSAASRPRNDGGVEIALPAGRQASPR